MSKTRILVATASLLIIWFAVQAVPPGENEAPVHLEIIGQSVAYQLWPPRSRHLGPDRLDYDVVVKVVTVLSGQESAKYIRMRYRHSKGDPDLPRNFNDGKSKWRLALFREPDCDNGLTFEIPLMSDNKEVGRIPAFQRPPGTQSEPLPISVLPCYVLDPGHFREQGD